VSTNVDAGGASEDFCSMNEWYSRVARVMLVRDFTLCNILTGSKDILASDVMYRSK